MGRSKYETHVRPKLILVEAWCRDGLTFEQVAEKLGVAQSTLHTYRDKYPEFSESLKRGREVADVEVENALFREATGYHYDEDMVTNQGEVVSVSKFARPSTTAQIFWLKNRRPDKWRDKRDVEHSGTVSLADVLTEAWQEEDGDT